MHKSADTKKTSSKREDLYFTEDHEWIDFQGSVAYIGVSVFKLTGIRSIDRIILPEIGAFFNANDIIGSLSNSEYEIHIHMPVSGRVLSCNEELVRKNFNSLMVSPENKGWILLIGPSLPYDRTGLMASKRYQLKHKTII